MEGDLFKVFSPQKLQSLEEWLLKNSITLTQVNGQRRYGGPPPDWRGVPPGSGCEVFISQIPRDVYEDQLIPLFQSVAPLYEFRLMMNFSGQNRGFAYAKYGDSNGAAAAIRSLHLYPLQPGVRLSVRKSTEKSQLCLGELPAAVTREELLAVLHHVSDGVEGVTLKAAGNKGKETCALVHYSSHYAASMAKKVLVQAFRKLCGVSISVRWATSSLKSRLEEGNDEGALTPPGLKPPSRNSRTPPPRFNHSNGHSVRPPSPFEQRFSRAVGAPAAETAVQRKSSGFEKASADPVLQLRWMCELHGLGTPRYNVRYHHTAPDGFLYFMYEVAVPGWPVPLCGVVHILPSTCSSNMETEALRAAAEQLIQSFRRKESV